MKKIVLTLLLPIILWGNDQNFARLELDLATMLQHPDANEIIKMIKEKIPGKKIPVNIKKLKYIKAEYALNAFSVEIKGLDITHLLTSKNQLTPITAIKGSKKMILTPEITLYQFGDLIRVGTNKKFKDNQPVKQKDLPELVKISTFKTKPVWGLYSTIPNHLKPYLQLKSMPYIFQNALDRVTGVTIRGGKIEGKDQFEITLYLPKKSIKEIFPQLQQLHKQSILMLGEKIKYHNHKEKLDQFILNLYRKSVLISHENQLILRMEAAPLHSFTLFASTLSAIAMPSYIKYITNAKLNALNQNMSAAKQLIQQGFRLNQKQNIIDRLNSGHKHAPFNQMGDAFTLGKPIPKSGQIQLTGTGSCKLPDLSTCKAGDTVIMIPSIPYNNRVKWPGIIQIIKK